MNQQMVGQRRRRRQWRFANATFDEGSWSLTLDGVAVRPEAKPLELLHELLLRAGEVVTKDELLDAVWPNVTVVEASLPTAIAKLRRALHDNEASIIETVPRIGYRLAVPVEVESLNGPVTPRFAFAPGDAVPRRPQWRMVAPLGDSGAQDVWRVRHDKTGLTRVFKFADAPDRLRGLKREVAIARLLMASLGPDGPFAQVIEWDFETAPYMIESIDGGASLVDWAAAHGGLDAIPLQRRLAVGAAVARALAAVHGVGILHKDLKPANILIQETGEDFHVRLSDFGSGLVTDEGLLAAHAITEPEPDMADASSSGSATAFYRAPELAAGNAVPTMRSDIYALGLVLFQLVVGDFGRSLAPGWEAAVADPLLRADIAEAAAGDPARRLASASALAERLETLDTRRAEHKAAEAQAARLEALKREAERRAARRPWVRAAAVAGLLGLAGTSTAAFVATRQKAEAEHQAAIAQSSYSFLADDLLSRADPARGNGVTETLAEAAKRAAAEIDRRFAAEPLIAGRLHGTLAKALWERGDIPGARDQFAAAGRSFAAGQATDSEEAALTRLNQAQVEGASGQPEGLQRATRIIAAERKRLGARAEQGKLGFNTAKAEVYLNYFSDIHKADAAMGRALALAKTDPTLAPPRDLLRLHTMHALILMREGKAAQAEPEMRQVVADATRMLGPTHADTLNARQNLLNAIQLQHRNADFIAGATELLPLMEKVYGPDHRFTTALLSGRADALATLGRYDEAVADAREERRRAVASAGATSYLALVGHSDTGIYLCRGGRAAEGVGELRGALADIGSALGKDHPLAHAARYYLAECLIETGDTAQAKTLLDGVATEKVAELVGDPGWGANVDLARADLAARAGDTKQAAALLAKAAPAFADTVPANFDHRRMDRIRRAIAGNGGQAG